MRLSLAFDKRIQVPTYRLAKNMFAIRMRTHWHTEPTRLSHIYTKMR